jgi:hypothetical protein
MSRIIRALFLFSLVSLIAVPWGSAQKSPTPPAAPVPAQILSAKKVFIANGGSAVESADDTISPNLPYDELYAGMRSWGRYELLSAPADADLVLEIRFVTVTANAGKTVFVKRQLELLLIDPKTHITLWTIDEQFDAAILDGNKRKDLDTGIAALLSDLKRLTDPSAPAEPANKEKSSKGSFF